MRCTSLRVVWAAAVVTVAGLLVTSCAKRPLPKVSVNVGHMGFASDLPLYVALEHGLFAKRGLDVKLTQFTAANDMMISLVRGDVLATGGIGPTTFYSLEETDPGRFRLVGFAEENEKQYSAAVLVPKNSSIRSLAQLRGKKIGTYTGSTQLLNVRLVLQNSLGSPEAAQIVQVSPSLQIGALERGDFDALFCIEPVASTAVLNNVARVLVPNPRVKFIMNPFPAAACAVSSRWLRESPAHATRFREALAEAIRILAKSPAEAQKLLPKYTKTTPEVANAIHNYAWYEPGQQHPEAWQRLADLMLNYKLLRRPIKVDALYPETSPRSQ